MNSTLINRTLAQEHFRTRMVYSTGPIELERRLREGEEMVLIDVREVDDYARGHLPGAISLPKDQWPLAEGLSRDALNVVYCDSHVCHLADMAAAEFSGRGYAVLELAGGLEAWRANKLPIEG